MLLCLVSVGAILIKEIGVVSFEDPGSLEKKCSPGTVNRQLLSCSAYQSAFIEAQGNCRVDFAENQAQDLII